MVIATKKNDNENESKDEITIKALMGSCPWATKDSLSCRILIDSPAEEAPPDPILINDYQKVCNFLSKVLYYRTAMFGRSVDQSINLLAKESLLKFEAGYIVDTSFKYQDL